MPYPYYNAQPYSMGYNQQNFANTAQNPGGLHCRPVTCIDEVRATQVVDFSGTPMVFLDAAHGMAYTKAFNAATGDSEIIQYRRVNAQQMQPVTMEAFSQLQQTVATLQQKLESIKNVRVKEEYPYEQPDRQYPQCYPQRRKPYADDYADSAEQPQLETSDQYLARQRRSAARADSTEHVQGEGYQPR